MVYGGCEQGEGERATLYTLVRLMMSAGDCPAKYIARTENLHGDILYWPAQHVLVEKGQ